MWTRKHHVLNQRPLSFGIIIFLISTCTHNLLSQCTNSQIWLTNQDEVDAFVENGCSAITGSLWIIGGAEDLSGLATITSISGGLLIQNNEFLTSLSGFENLVSVGEIDIRDNPQLASLTALSNITTIPGGDGAVNGNLVIRDCNSLISLEGLHNIQSTANHLWVEHNQGLTDLEGLRSLQSVGGTAWINDNDLLTDLSGLENLNSTNRLGVVFHEALQDLSGLEGLTTIPEGLILRSNVSMTSLHGLENIISVGRELYIYDLPIANLLGLSSLTTVGGDPLEINHYRDGLTLWNCPDLNSLVGLESLTSISGSLELNDLDVIIDLSGLNGLNSVGGQTRVVFNDEIKTLDGLTNLSSLGTHLSIFINPKLSTCSIAAVCDYLDDPDAIVQIHSNAISCLNEEQVRSNCSPLRDYTLIDANPELVHDLFFLQDIYEIRDLSEENILETEQLKRDAIVADGVTQVVVVAKFNESGVVNFEFDEVVLETPWGTSTIENSGNHYAFGILRAPDIFPEEASSPHSQGQSSSADISIDVFHSGDEVTESAISVKVMRPPVVLVHGTFGNPESWTNKSEEQSMKEKLEDSGFDVFMVDYENTNGNNVSGPSSFEDNAEVIWDNGRDGGIKAALDYYRDTHNAAATQVDVVGHSLGGILPRVYASEHYNSDYKRYANFMQGDINRLITIASTHFGSHLGEFQSYLEGATIIDVGLLGWMANSTVLATAWLKGASLSGAVMDQIPPPPVMNNALAQIGRTSVPAHAFTCRVPLGELKDPVHDPNEEYYNFFHYMSMLFYYNATMTEDYLDFKLELCDLPGVKAPGTKSGDMPSLLYPDLTEEEIFKTMFVDAIDREGSTFELLDGEWEMPTDIEIFDPIAAETAMSDWDPLIDQFAPNSDPVDINPDIYRDYITPEAPETPDRPVDLAEALRFMIFNNDDNDGTVRVESQSGELEKECENCITSFDRVFHRYAPEYSIVQNRLVELLKSGMDDFNMEGFPPADHVQTLYYPPTNIMPDVEVSDEDNAICQSGMVRSHAKAFAGVADRQNTVIIGRPVNPDATVLIEQGAATKEMDVKPKSSNWGPQKGYLPVNQRYSKLWEVFTGDTRLEKIEEYSQKSQENIESGITVARQLVVTACNTDYFVHVDSAFNLGQLDGNAKDEIVLVPVDDPTRFCLWGDTFDKDAPIREEDCEEITQFNRLGPFEVMATPRELERDGVTKKFLTADYDLLMFGFYKGVGNNPYDPPKDLPFKDGVGQITDEQEQLIDLLNTAVKRSGYTGGNVSHHGPENQFGKSPYIDYPLTAFLPGDPDIMGDGEIRTIRMGEDGFRDIHLKNLVNEMRSKGYDLYDNAEAPGWKWTWSEDLNGFELEDSPELSDYVEELPTRDCHSKTGSNQTSSADCPSPLLKEGVLTPEPSERNSGRFSFKLMPNPIIGNELQLIIDTPLDMSMDWQITDPMGNVKSASNFNVLRGENVHTINLNNCETGMYYLTTSTGWTGRFIKI